MWLVCVVMFGWCVCEVVDVIIMLGLNVMGG